LGIILMFLVLRGVASHRVSTSEITDVPAFARSCVPGCGLLNHLQFSAASGDHTCRISEDEIVLGLAIAFEFWGFVILPLLYHFHWYP
jgi:hypothetical protein